MDTGGWFMTFKATAVIKEMDLASKDVDLLIKAVTQKINGGENGLSDRNILTKKAMEISR
jgi:predicted chitinase